MKTLVLFLSVVLNSSNVFSHEGHNNAPGSFKSLHGGTVQNGKELNLEFIVNGTELTIYPTGHDSKDVPTSLVKVSAMAKPKKGKPYPVVLTPAKVGYRATLNLEGANRLPVEIKTESNGKSDKFTIQIEE